MDFSQIQELIRMVSKHKLSEFNLKEGDFRLIIRNQTSQENAAPTVVHTFAPPPASVAIQPPASPALAPKADLAPVAAPAIDENAKYVTIKSPMVGTFYRSSGPDKPPFLKVGDEVQIGQTVCVIEAMKLFNEIESELRGKVVKVLVEDSTPVEYDQPLFLLDPA